MSLVFGMFHLSLWGYIIVTLLMTHVSVMAITLYLHRSQAHGSVVFHPIISHFFRFWLWMSSGANTKEWVSIHRKHHATCETVDDPHSPQVLGIKKVFWEGAELYRAEAKNQTTLNRFGKGTPDDWMERNVYSKHGTLGIGLMLAIDLVLFGVVGLTIWALQMVWMPFWAAGFVNGVGHYWGYRNFECADASRNILPIGLIVGGEELHNNHHTYPTSAKLSFQTWEFDIGWFYIRLMEICRLAKVIRVAPKLSTIPDKNVIDMETLRAVFANRFQVCAQYTKEVVLPVFRNAKSKAAKNQQTVFAHAKALLVKDHTLLVDEKEKKRLSTLLESCMELKTVYLFRIKLQQLWNSSKLNQKELLVSLKEWCEQAEGSGINALSSFAKNVRKLSLAQGVAA